ncbi:MAG: hypothetical protein AB1591_02670 [Pseudomonadota bacterium]
MKILVIPMADHFLLLYPKNPAWAPARLAPLLDALKAIGFLGTEHSAGLYGAGPEYLSLVSYLGCSPQIALGDNEAATTIRIAGIFDAPRFVQDANLKPPRCPQCRKMLDKPAAPVEAGGNLRCNHCGHSGNACDFDWRRSAACGRVFIGIANVFESEAVPGEALADCLRKASGEAWDYCYVRKD